MTIAISGASGELGRATAERLLRTTDPSTVVLTTRRPEALADLAERGADVRHADFADAASLATAFAGVERLLLISTDAVGARLDHHRAAITAAVSAGVRHIVYTSFPEPVGTNPALVAADHEGTEKAMRESGARWTMLRNNLYSHMQVPGLEHAAESGRMFSNSGAGGTAYVTREDCAAAAAAVLTQDGHADTAYDITGPEAVTGRALAAIASEIGGRDVELVEVDDAEFADGLTAAGLPGEVATLVASFGASARDGYLGNVSTAVADLTGQQPTALIDVVRAARAG